MSIDNVITIIGILGSSCNNVDIVHFYFQTNARWVKSMFLYFIYKNYNHYKIVSSSKQRNLLVEPRV